MNTLNVIFDHVSVEDDDNMLSGLPALLYSNSLFDQSGQLNRRDLVIGKTKLPLGFMSVGKKITVMFDYQNTKYVGNGSIVSGNFGSGTNDTITIHFKLS